MGRNVVQPSVAKFLSEQRNQGVMFTMKDVAKEFPNFAENSISGALVRLAASPGTDVQSPTRGVYVYRPGSDARSGKGKPHPVQATEKPIRERVYEGVGATKSGRIIVRDTDDNDRLYTLSDEV